VVSVPPAFAADAVFEAIEAGIPLVVVVTERIPRKQVAQFVEYAQQQGTRIIGPNCLGVISPGKTRVGGIGGAAESTERAFHPGRIGVMSRSGGMTVEIANSLSEAGLGVSTAVSIGGDAIIGSTYAELMPLFDADPQTDGIAIYSEPGGRAEYELAEYMQRAARTKPIVAFMAGKLHGRDARHALRPRRHHRRGQARTPRPQKIANLAAAGITVAEKIGDIPRLMKERLAAGEGA
jgi:succinyl-CoA synthetase alpha subunit